MTEKPNNKRRAILTAIICCTYLLLTICYHHIDKYLTGVCFLVLTIIIPITFIAIVVYAIKGIINLFLNRQNLTFKLVIPVIICSLTLLYTIFCPYQYRLDSEKLESKVDFRACYEGTQNQAYILFRQDKTFELNWTGVFGYDEWFTGHWEKSGDTLFLKYDNKKVKQLGDKILISNGYLNPIGNSVDKKKFPRPMFYLGYCKHEN